MNELEESDKTVANGHMGSMSMCQFSDHNAVRLDPPMRDMFVVVDAAACRAAISVDAPHQLEASECLNAVRRERRDLQTKVDESGLLWRLQHAKRRFVGHHLLE